MNKKEICNHYILSASRFAISTGRSPEMAVPASERKFKAIIDPISAGRVPLKKLSAKFRDAEIFKRARC